MVLDLKPFPPHTAHLDSTASEINQYFKKKGRKKKKNKSTRKSVYWLILTGFDTRHTRSDHVSI